MAWDGTFYVSFQADRGSTGGFRIPVVLFDTPEIFKCENTFYLLSPYQCFIGFNYHLFVAEVEDQTNLCFTTIET